jgi:hypothetical protein
MADNPNDTHLVEGIIFVEEGLSKYDFEVLSPMIQSD